MVFPDPDGPNNVNKIPFLIFKLILSTAKVSPKSIVNSFISIAQLSSW
ncbi:Uncharacterised protein, partial [Mesomycoplasma hyorhinis]